MLKLENWLGYIQTHTYMHTAYPHVHKHSHVISVY